MALTDRDLTRRVEALEAFASLVRARLMGDYCVIGTGTGRPVRLVFLTHGAPGPGLQIDQTPHLLAHPTARQDADGIIIPPVVTAVDPVTGEPVSGGPWRIGQAALETADGIITVFTLTLTPVEGSVWCIYQGTVQVPSSVSGREVTLGFAPTTGNEPLFCFQEAT